MDLGPMQKVISELGLKRAMAAYLARRATGAPEMLCIAQHVLLKRWLNCRLRHEYRRIVFYETFDRLGSTAEFDGYYRSFLTMCVQLQTALMRRIFPLDRETNAMSVLALVYRRVGHQVQGRITLA
ncbi:hypothetical protein SPRG_16660 [Saprolegnia parasitica CBS 223.65]|uniref:Uncharacterized protein n=1 Tax=Saprolegnia parasitica (strain CBS 223.65) TaxID=695850 RepID=A0A067BUG7_SAPPC|nr:hypothetical protein SPRG_16660 [Saprolegnia parasitica CBS 223.65]KDO17936.1 hypothetical protein SPRG_16660 [Saprolegnia parasitica CBS 223.65]|eukprot:XP_012211359.1 hypothetical protein SPRG_16660 [Saprolegnia parasitica CBS 223.65]